jgi:glycerol-3-phosphate acyltransferase PlsY
MENQILTKCLVLLGCYLAGGIPTGYLITRRLKGIDIREHGSGNPGAANVYRTVGKGAGWATFLTDAAKGFLCVQAAFYFFPGDYIFAAAAGLTAIAGHMWTIFLKFRGGKGVATGAGVFGALLPGPTVLGFIAFVIAVWKSGHISTGSMAAATVLAASSFFIGAQPWQVNAAATLVWALVIYKHIPNIKRIYMKKELPFEDGSKKNNEK